MKKDIIDLKLLTKVIENTEDEIVLLELYGQVTKLGEIVINKVIRTLFYNLPVETEDLSSLSYFCMLDTINWIKLSNEAVEKFPRFFVYKLRNICINYCRKFITNKHFILNNYDNYEYEVIDTSINLKKDLAHDFRVKHNIELIAEILKGLQKKIFLMKMSGHSYDEISVILNVPIQKIRYEVRKMRENNDIKSIINI
ncbi:MAG: hypothetical protein ACRC42_01805 [Mycoplasma sp.]